MTEKIMNQSKKTPWIFRRLKTSVEIILIALFLFYSLCMCLSLMAGPISGLLDLGIGTLPILLALTVFLALQERVSRSSPSVKVSLGVILVLLAIINSYHLVEFINFFVLDDFLYRDSALYLILAVFIIGMLVSLWYSSHQKFQRRSIVTIHALTAVLFMLFFVFQFANVRKNQALVLQTYDDYFLHDATEEISIYSVEYNFWSNKAYIIIGTYPPTFWNRPTRGDFYELEFVNGQWVFTGQTGHFID